jgi:hypothetical protein
MSYGVAVTSRRSTAAGLAVAALLLAGCGSGASSAPAASAASASAAPTTSSSDPTGGPTSRSPVGGWTRVTDRSSGLSFSLPGTPRTQSKPAAGGFTGRVYQAQVGSGGVAVSIELADHDIGSYDVLAVLRAITAGLRRTGATHVDLHDLRRVSSQGMTGYDARISFLSTDRTKVSYWRVRALHDDRRVVELQALTFVDPQVGHSAVVDTEFGRLVRSFRTG